MKKRLLSILLVATMLLAMIPAMMVAVSAENTTPIDWANDKIITIYTADELVEFKKQISQGNSFAGKTVKLGADIDMTGKTLALADSDKGFCGVFDGQFYTIRNLSFSNNSSYQGALFGSSTVTKLDAAGQQAVKEQGGIIVKNFALVNSTLSSNKRTAPLFAWVFGDLTVENVYISAKVTGSGGDCTGGFIGDAAVGKITFKNCVFEGTVTNSAANVSGAFVGRLRNDKAPTVVLENCLNASEVALVGTTYGGTTNKETATNCLHYNEANKETIGSGLAANAPAGFTNLNAGYPVPTPLALPFFSAKIIDWSAEEIEIATADQFKAFHDMLASGETNFAGQTVKLVADIDMTGYVINPYAATTGTLEDKMGFFGKFDGQYHTLSGITMAVGTCSGLFGSANTSEHIEIKNLALINSTFTNAKESGTFYGTVAAKLTFENVYCSVTLSGTNFVGGFIGSTRFAGHDVEFTNCVFDGKVTATGYGASSFIGANCYNNQDGADLPTFTNCLATGEYINGSAAWLNGCRFIGHWSKKTDARITDCVNYGQGDESVVDTVGAGLTAVAPAGFTAMNASYPVPTTLLPFFADRVEDNRTAKDEGVKLVTEFYGIQLNADKTAVRLVGAVNSAVADLSAVGYEVSIIRDNGKVWSGSLETQAVYTSVLEDGKAEATTAEACGGDYVYVAAIDGLQANKGVITLVIKTYSIDQDNNKIYTDMSIVSYDSALVA